MDDEQIENQLEERQHILDTLGMPLEAYEHFKYNAVNGLLKFGGSFAAALGQALAAADSKNCAKILRYWHQECEQHSILYKMYLAKQNAAE